MKNSPDGIQNNGLTPKGRGIYSDSPPPVREKNPYIKMFALGEDVFLLGIVVKNRKRRSEKRGVEIIH